MIDAGFTVISPTRPGFGRTPLASGPTPEEAADLLAALLDELSIDQVLMFGISGGGPTSLQFALRHPNRCKALMTEVAVTGGFTHPKAAELGGASTRFAITSATFARVGAYYANNSPEKVIGGMMGEMSTYTGPEAQDMAKEVASDPGRVERLHSLMR